MYKNNALKKVCFGILLCNISTWLDCSNNSASLQSLPAPYCNLEKILPFNGHGWYLNAPWIETLFKNNSIITAVEIGSWLGSSTRHIASLLPAHGKLYAIDTWEGSIEHYQNEHWSSLLPTLYEQFLSNVIHSNLTEKIVPIRMSSQNAISELALYGQSFDLIYIDAAHDTESVLKDLASYFPLVQNNKGILCGDDWDAESVRIAVLQFSQQHNLTVYGAYNFWFVAEENSYAYHSFAQANNTIWKFPKNN